MSFKNISASAFGRLCAVVAGFVVLAACGGGSSSSTTTTPTGTPSAMLSASTLTFTSGVGIASATQSVTVTNSGSASLNFSSITVSTGFTQNNTCGTAVAAGSSCTISVGFTPTSTTPVSGSLTITDNASPSTQTVTLNGTGTSASVAPASLTFSGITVNTTSPAQTVTLNNAGSTTLTVTSISTAAPFGETNTCGASVPANGGCSISVTFTPTVSGTVNGTLTIVDASGTQTVSLTGSNTVANQAQVTVGFGINGNTNNSETNYYNGIFTTVNVCQPGTTTCVTVPNVLVDTGSVGLRVLSSAISGVTLPQVVDTSTGPSYPIYECVQFGDLSYTWGPMQMATVQVGAESATQVPTASGGTANAGIPIQVIAAGQTPPSQVGFIGSNQSYYNPCLYYPGTTSATGGNNDDTIATLGANGILGVGNYPQDCGTNCTSTANTNGSYLICTAINSATCDIQAVAVKNQAWNPVSAFPVDNTGVSINIPSIPAAGTTSVNGTLTFGIGTQTNNAISNTAAVYELDTYGNFGSATFQGVGPITSTNSGGSFIDSGSNAYFISDGVSLNNTPDCIVSTIDIGYFCPSAPLSLQLGLTGSNNTTTTVTLPIQSATTLFTSTSYAAFNDLGGPSCTPAPSANVTCSLADDYFDLGLPFFFGRPIYVGIQGSSTTYPNGYWAF